MKARRPVVNLRAASKLAAPGERVATFRFADGSAGVVSFVNGTHGQPNRIEVYRLGTGPGVAVLTDVKAVTMIGARAVAS